MPTPLRTDFTDASPMPTDHAAHHNALATLANAGGGGTTRITATGIALGSQTAGQTAFTWYTIPGIAARGLVSQFTVTADAGGSFDVEVRGAGAPTGSLWLQAIAITGLSYSNPAPWYVENDVPPAQDLYVGVRNTGVGTRTFTLTALRVERFA